MALVYQMQQALARQRGLDKSSSSSTTGKNQKSLASYTSPDQSSMQRPSRRRQHIVRREDGSILIINYEDFNQLISQPLNIMSSEGSSGSGQPSSAQDSSKESSMSDRNQSSASGSSSSQSEDSSQNDGYLPGSSSDHATTFSDSAMSSVHKDPRCSSGEEADLILTPPSMQGFVDPSRPNTLHIRTESGASTVRLNTSNMKNPTD